MKRKYAGLLGIFICLLLLSACSLKENAAIKKNGGLSASAIPIAKAETENKITAVKDSQQKLPKDAVILKGKIIKKKSRTILVAD